MKFHAQVKRVARKSLVSNDTSYEVLLITDRNLAELMDVRADELVDVEIDVRDDR